jgi:hypothetical protein
MNYLRSALIVLATSLSPEEEAFNKFIIEFDKQYATKEEYNFRLNIFKDTLKFNKEMQEDGLELGLNHMSDWT